MRKHIYLDAHSLSAMLRNVAAFALAFIVLLFTPQVAEARIKIPVPAPWGTSQEVHHIQPITLPNPDIKDAYLGYVTEKTHILWIFGLYMDNQGYAIGSGKESDNRGELISQSDFKELQNLGIISKDLPSELSLSFFDILEGFSLWWIIGLGVCLRLGFRRKT